MGLTWFDGWTEPIPLGGCSILEITVTKPHGDSWIHETPPLNKWRVDHIVNSVGSWVVILSRWDKDHWTDVYSEHSRGMDWEDIWAELSAVVGITRLSMLP